MPTQSFLEARRRGKQGQHFVAEIVRSWGVQVEEVEDGFFQDYDLRLSNDKTIEVKHDFMASKTGNLCLEIEALEHSKADVLAIVVDNPRTIYFKELPPVRDFARQWHKKARVGEFHLEAALVPRSIFLDRMKPAILTTNPQ